MKSTQEKQRDPAYERTVTTIAWFVQLAHAKLRNDFAKAAEAQEELERMGVTVKFRRRAVHR